MKLFAITSIFLCYSQILFGQLEFTKQERLLFVGADNIKGKQIVAGVHILPIDSKNLKLQIDVLEDWVKKDSLSTFVTLDETSVANNIFFVKKNNDDVPSYRYYNEQGLQIFIAKESWHDDSYNASGQKLEKFYTLSVLEILLPDKNRFYLKKLPIMFEK